MHYRFGFVLLQIRISVSVALTVLKIIIFYKLTANGKYIHHQTYKQTKN